jgi:ParB-like chromosome segregation protein Spo0J
MLGHLIPVCAIHILRPRREPDAAVVAELAGSLAVLGLLHPICVAPHPDAPGQYALIAGANRLAAAKRLGWTEIPAVVRTFGVIESELAEISENVHRHELTPAEEAIQARRFVELVAKLHDLPVVRPTKDVAARAEIADRDRDAPAAVPKRNAAKVLAEELNVSPATAYRMLNRTRALDDGQLKTLGHASARDIDAVADLPTPTERAAVVDLVGQGWPVRKAILCRDLPDEDRRALFAVTIDDGACTAIAAMDDLERVETLALVASGLPPHQAIADVLAGPAGEGDALPPELTEPDEPPVPPRRLSPEEYIEANLPAALRKTANAQALLASVTLYRDTEAARLEFQRAIGYGAVKKDRQPGPYGFRLRRLLDVPPPSQWFPCASCDRGLDRGQPCRQCHGAGFTLD